MKVNVYSCSSESLVVTSGATHGLHLVASVLLTSNAPVFVEDPTYFIAIDIVKKDLGRPVIGGENKFCGEIESL